MTDLKELVVYQKSRLLAVDAINYFLRVNRDRRKEYYISQILRAITSIGANIAEGYGRFYSKNYIQFLKIARGSSYEVSYWLELAIDTKMFNNEIMNKYFNLNQEILKMLSKLIKNSQNRA